MDLTCVLVWLSESFAAKENDSHENEQKHAEKDTNGDMALGGRGCQG